MGQQARGGATGRLVATGAALVVLALLAAGCYPGVRATRTSPPSAAVPEFDAYGGLLSVEAAATGRFRVEPIDGVWWFVTPDGHGLWSAGIDHVTPDGDYAPAEGTSPYRDAVIAKYGTEEAWADAAVDRMTDWGFNTLGAWSATGLFTGRIAYTEIMSFADAAPEITSAPTDWIAWAAKPIRDFWDPAFETGAAAEAAGVQGCADDPWCIGVYTDNELPWSLSFVQSTTFLNAYMTLPAGAPGKVALQAHLSDRYEGDVAAFNAAWGTHLADFDDLQNLDAIGIPGPLGRIFETAAQRADRKSFVDEASARYHSVVHDAIRADAPDVLVLGSRFISVMTPPSVMAAAAPYVDVLSINSYHFVPELVPVMDLLFPNEGFGFLDDPWGDLDALYGATAKPVLITEYSYRAYVPGGPPSWMPPGYAILRTQAERAAYYSHFTNELYDRPFVVGAHWFQWMDQPASGRGDGENNNFGVVTITDDTYVELTDAMRAMNGAVRVREP